MTIPQMKTVFVSVVCDLFHVGHLNFLERARLLGDHLVVGVLTDEVVESYKRRPVIPQGERLRIVKSLKCVDGAFLQHYLDPIRDLQGSEELRSISIIAHGDDWPNDFPGAEYMRSIGKQAVNIPYYKDQSTSKVIEEILRREKCGPPLEKESR